MNDFIESEIVRIRSLKYIDTELEAILNMQMRDPHTGVMGKISRKRIDPAKIKLLEIEYKKIKNNEDGIK